MNTKLSYSVVGAFVIALSTIFIWAILWISSGGRSLQMDNYLIYTNESVSGLNVDSPIKYRGVDVGRTRKISIDQRNPELIRLLIEVQEGTPINQGTIAVLEYQGMTGIANINLKGGVNGEEPITIDATEEFAVINSGPSLFSSLDDDLPLLMSNLTDSLNGISHLLDIDNRENFATFVANISVLSSQLTDHSEQIDSLFGHTEIILENASVASAELPNLMQAYSGSAKQMSTLFDDIEKIATSLASVSNDIEGTLSESGSDLRRFTSNTLPELADAVIGLKQVSENLRRMSEILANNPSALIYRGDRTTKGPGE